jgi:hypothetical protein
VNEERRAGALGRCPEHRQREQQRATTFVEAQPLCCRSKQWMGGARDWPALHPPRPAQSVRRVVATSQANQCHCTDRRKVHEEV